MRKNRVVMLSHDRQRWLKTLGNNIKAKRSSLGLAASDLASSLGISVGTQYNRERGQPFYVDDLFRYCHALNCKPKDLLP